MMNLVYILSQTEIVATLRHIIHVAFIVDSWFVGLMKLGTTPGGGGAAGVSSRLDTGSCCAVEAIIVNSRVFVSLGVRKAKMRCFTSAACRQQNFFFYSGYSCHPYNT